MHITENTVVETRRSIGSTVKGIPALLLINPEDLPRSYSDIQRRRTEHIANVLNLHLSQPCATSIAHPQQAVVNTWRALGEREFPQEELHLPRELADPDSHDDYCCIVRVSDSDTLHVFVSAILKAYEKKINHNIVK